MRYSKHFALCVFFIAANIVFGQKNYYKDAEKAYMNHEYFTAIDLYKKAVTKAKKATKAEILFKTAECYRLINDQKQAESYYSKAIKAKYPDPVAHLYMANAKKAQEKYSEAMTDYANYKKEVPSDKRGEDGIKSCELAIKWKESPTRHKVENLQQINTKEWDYAPCWADKRYTTIYFSSTREGAMGGGTDNSAGQIFADIFETQVDKNGKWKTPTPLAAPLNSKYNEAAPVMNKKLNTMYFTRCGVEKNKHVKCQIYVSQKKGNAWDEPKPISFNVDSNNLGHPTVNPEETILVFSSDLPGGYGGLDLWMSKFDKKAKTWGNPVNLGPTINSSGDELYPYISDDGSLYFSSDGHLGMGGLDIFKADMKGEGSWDNVTNLKFPMNSAGDDFGIIFEGKFERGYFTSNRAGGKGGDDIYRFTVPPLIYTLSGVVTEKESRKPIENAAITLIGSDGTKFEIKTDKTGFYRFDANGAARYINESTSYVVGASGVDIKTPEAPDGYLGNPKNKFTTVGETKSKDFKQDFELLLVKKEIKMPLVLFNLNKYDLAHPSNPKDSLEFLYKTLVENPTIVVELGAHTDSRNSAEYNQKLSFDRAKTCVEYIISKGIPGDRIVAKGYGESKPKTLDNDVTLPSGKVVPKGTVLQEAFINKFKANKNDFEALHEMNRRVVFSILRKDYKPKDGIKEDNPFPEIQLNNDLIEGGGEDGDIDTGDKKNEKTTTMPGGNPDKPKN
jgi:peptidoglycan-associated lipoprotein